MGFFDALFKKRETIKNFPIYFIDTTKYRKKDGHITRGKAYLEFTDNEFFIKQDENVIENNIGSIYTIRFWEYEDYYYCCIKMRSWTEYTFGIDGIDAQNDIVENIKGNGITIETMIDD